MNSWKSKGLLSALIVLAGLVISGTAFAQGHQDFTLVNMTGYDIFEVYVSPSKSADWSDDVMEMDILPNSSKVNIVFPGNPDVCTWDLAVVFEDEEIVEWYNFDLCSISRITLFYDDDSKNAWAKHE